MAIATSAQESVSQDVFASTEDVALLRVRLSALESAVALLRIDLAHSPSRAEEQQATAIIKGVAAELQHAAHELLRCADTLKGLHKGSLANQAYLAHKRALEAAREILG